MLISTVVFLFFLFLTYALFLLASRKSHMRQERLKQRVSQALNEPMVSHDASMGISRGDTIGGGEIFGRALASLDFIKKLERLIRQADVDVTVSRLLFSRLSRV